MSIAVVAGKAVLVWLVTDFLSGLFHWLEDSYGGPFWPVFGRHVTKPNILHHYAPRAFVTNSWFLSSRLLLLIGTMVVLLTLALGVFNWMVGLAVLLGVNANQVHKWSHRTRGENGRFVGLLQRARLIQSPSHHHRHHIHGKDSNYCVLTDFLNPILDGTRFWRGLEGLVERAFGIRKRDDETMALLVLQREPEFYGENLPLMLQRLGLDAPPGRKEAAQPA